MKRRVGRNSERVVNKERRRPLGLEVRPATQYTGRKRKPRFQVLGLSDCSGSTRL